MLPEIIIVHKPTGREETVSKVRNSGIIETLSGTKINSKEFDLNWKYKVSEAVQSKLNEIGKTLNRIVYDYKRSY